jgi:drug/metabolite transporter (DMT)-like permease
MRLSLGWACQTVRLTMSSQMSSLAVPSARTAAPPAPTHPPTAALPGALDVRAVAVMSLLCFTSALQQISLKAVSDQISPMLMVALRSLVAALLLGGLMAWRRERLDRSLWGAGAVVGSLFALEFLLVAEAVRLTAATHVVVFLYTAPLFAVLGLHLLRPEERLVRRQWIGVALAFCGTALAFLGGNEGQMVHEVHEGQEGLAGQPPASAAWLGDALALLAGLAWGATTITIRNTRLTQAPATETLLYQLVGAVVWLLPMVGLTGQWQFEPTLRVWAHLGFHSVVVAFAGFLTWFWLMRRYLASRLGVFSFLTPLLGVVLGSWLLGESLAPTFVMGSVLVLAGIVLASRPGGGRG